MQYRDCSHRAVYLSVPFIRIRELNRANAGCPMPTRLERRPRHFLLMVAVEGSELSFSGEPIRCVSVLEPKPFSLYQCCQKGSGQVRGTSATGSALSSTTGMTAAAHSNASRPIKS